jgi:hypothetical protein
VEAANRRNPAAGGEDLEAEPDSASPRDRGRHVGAAPMPEPTPPRMPCHTGALRGPRPREPDHLPVIFFFYWANDSSCWESLAGIRPDH